MTLLTLDEARQHAEQAGRGSKRSLGLLLRSIIAAEAAPELQFLNDVVAGTGAVSKALVLDSSGGVDIPGEVEFDGNELEVTAGVGITGGSGTVVKSSAIKVGGIITTKILIYLDGLVSKDTENDIIGDDDTGVAYLGRVTAARNGTILGGIMECLEVPAGGEVDIDLYSALEATGVEDSLITALDETKIIDAAADWTLGLKRYMAAVPVNGKGYLYLAVGTGTTPTAAEYTAGKFLITLYGYDA